MENPFLFEYQSDYSFPFDEQQLCLWLSSVLAEEGKQVDQILFVFCTDEYLLEINQQHLHHDYYTDIITFPYNYEPIESEIYISLERVADNAQKLKVSYAGELSRVIVHGLLHMCGYNDKSKSEQAVMREKESYYMVKLAK